MEPETCTDNPSSRVGVNYCPVCQQEYIQEEKNNCPNCGWDITPHPLTSPDQTPEAFVQKEQFKLDWAKQVWARLKLQEEQVKQILAIFHTQSNAISSLREQSNQEQLAELAALFKEQKQQWQHEIAASQFQLAEILTTQKQQWQHEITASQFQLREILAQIKQKNQLPTLAEAPPDDLSSEVEIDDTLVKASPDDLRSEVGVDYTRLRNLLRDGKWQEADQETYQMMLVVSSREEERVLGKEAIAKFPCTDLRTIDKLWVKYSIGNFGFSVQKEIWLGVGESLRGGILEDRHAIGREFRNRVGWRVNNKSLDYELLTFRADAPMGHLPYFPNDQSVFFSRLETCACSLCWGLLFDRH